MIPQAVCHILHTLNARGYDAWAVGGCVRDTLMGRAPDDWDIATEATCEEVKRTFPDNRVVPTGIRHGTVTLIDRGVPYEITTYRLDGQYTDHRHPAQVTFSRAIADDLKRRDFTINAMALHPEKGLLDPFGGGRDIDLRVLRAVGDAMARFDEDALRMLRALRFSAKLGFMIEETTREAIRARLPLLRLTSVERVWKELTGILSGAYAARALADYGEILLAAVPQARIDPDAIARAASLPARLALTLDPQTLLRLHADGATVERIARIQALMKAPIDSTYALRRLAGAIGFADAWCLLEARDALGEDVACARKTLAEIQARGDCVSLKTLNINGADLLRLGMMPGTEIGAMLQSLLDQVVSGELPNDTDALIRSASARLPSS